MNDVEFISLWTANTLRVFAYILTLEPNRANAEDILQDTAVTIWEKRGEFRGECEFRTWACRIAYFKTLSHLRRSRALETVGERLMETLSAEVIKASENLDDRLSALSGCIEKLSPRNREILSLRYHDRSTVQHIAGKLNCSLIGAYKALQRLHESLFECVRRGLAREESA